MDESGSCLREGRIWVVRAVVVLYLAGAAVALWRTDASWPLRVALAVLWPIGPAAFVLTVAILLAASVIAFPLVGAIVAAAAFSWWLLA